METENPIQWSDAAMFAFPLVVGLGLTGVVGVARRGGGSRDESPVCNERALHQPPGIVFAIVWPILYALLGASLVLLWRTVGRQWTPEVIGGIVGVLALQVWWFVFTFQCLPWGAFAFLVGLVIGFGFLAFRIYSAVGATVSSLLLLPLCAWLVFASYLSFEIATGRVVKKPETPITTEK